MTDKKILVVDDEKNICLTISIALQKNGFIADTALNANEAVKLMEKQNYDLVITDLKMPDIDGIQLLKTISQLRPEIKVIIISAFGVIENAVEAIKLGAIDFIPKPFSEIELVNQIKQIFERDNLNEDTAKDYNNFINLAKKSINERRFESAAVHIRKAISLSTAKPEAFNMLGILCDILGDEFESQKNYRIALEIDPTYKPARSNIERSTNWNHKKNSKPSW